MDTDHIIVLLLKSKKEEKKKILNEGAIPSLSTGGQTEHMINF